MTAWVIAAGIGACLAQVLLPAAEKLCVTGPAKISRGPRLGAVLAAAAAVSLVPAFGSLQAAAAMTMVFSTLFVVSAVDLIELRVPNRVVWPSSLVAASAAVGAAMAGDEGGVAALVGSAAFASAIGLCHLLRPHAMGLGDVKLSVFLGLVVGYHAASPLHSLELLGWTMAIASLLGLGMAAVRRSTAALPFAPALSMAAWSVSLSAQLVIR